MKSFWVAACCAVSKKSFGLSALIRRISVISGKVLIFLRSLCSSVFQRFCFGCGLPRCVFKSFDLSALISLISVISGKVLIFLCALCVLCGEVLALFFGCGLPRCVSKVSVYQR
jgi:hypothetical protein